MQPIFLTWCGFLGLCPCYKVANTWITLAIILMYLLLFFGGLINFGGYPTTLNVVTFITDTSALISLTFTTLKLRLFKFKDFRELLEIFKAIYVGQQKSKNWAILKFLVVNLVITVPHVFVFVRIANFTQLSWTYIVEISCVVLVNYYLHLQGILPIVIVQSIAEKLRCLNRVLGSLQDFGKLEFVRKSYNLLYIATASFNRLFGGIILVHLLTVSLEVLRLFYIILVFQAENLAGVEYTVLTLILKVVQIAVLATTCQELEDQNELALLHVAKAEMSQVSQQLDKLKEDLISKRLSVTAAGFIKVDCSALFTLANLMVTYYIAVTQMVTNGPFIEV